MVRLGNDGEQGLGVLTEGEVGRTHGRTHKGPGRREPAGALPCEHCVRSRAVSTPWGGQTVAGMLSMAGASTVSTLWAWRRPRKPRTNITAEPMKAAMAAHIAMVPRVAKA